MEAWIDYYSRLLLISKNSLLGCRTSQGLQYEILHWRSTAPTENQFYIYSK